MVEQEIKPILVRKRKSPKTKPRYMEEQSNERPTGNGLMVKWPVGLNFILFGRFPARTMAKREGESSYENSLAELEQKSCRNWNNLVSCIVKKHVTSNSTFRHKQS